MNTPRQRALELGERGVVSTAERDVLLEALGGPPVRRTHDRLLVDPFERLGGGPAVAMGAVVAAAGVLVARLGVRFDGLLDLHLVEALVPARTAVADQLASWVGPGLLAWAVGRGLAGGVRLRDALGAVGLARAPLVLLGPVLVVLGGARSPLGSGALPHLAAAFVALLALGWELGWLVAGLRNATGLRGTRLMVAAVLLVAGGELLSAALLGLVVGTGRWS